MIKIWDGTDRRWPEVSVIAIDDGYHHTTGSSNRVSLSRQALRIQRADPHLSPLNVEISASVPRLGYH